MGEGVKWYRGRVEGVDSRVMEIERAVQLGEVGLMGRERRGLKKLVTNC